MKKVMMIAAIAAALVSCQSKGNQNNNTMDEGVMTVAGNDSSAVAVYEGILPAADGPGIDYVLTLNAATDGIDTTYTLDMTYLDAQGQGQNETFTSNGKQQTIHKVVNKKPVTAVKLTPKSGEAPMYFVIVNDTTLRLVNDSLQEAVSDLNYDIIKVKQ